MNNLTFIQKIKKFIKEHKFWSIIIIILVVFVAYRVFFKTNTTTETRYITETVAKGSVIPSVSGSGQVEATNTITLKTKTSGDINYIGVSSGDTVKKGQLIASVDSSDAKIALENAQISLDKLTEAPDNTTLTQKKNALDKSYNDGWNLVSSSIIDLSSVLSGIDDLYNGYLSSSSIMLAGNSAKDKVSLGQDSYYKAKDELNNVSNLYKTLSRNSSQTDIYNLISKMYDVTKIVANSVKTTQTALDAVINSLGDSGTSKANNAQSSLTSLTTTANGATSDLLSSLNSITENTQALSDLLAGSDKLDIKSAMLNLESKQQAYNDCFLYAPFDGIVATLTAKVGDSGSSIGTLITKQKNVTISLNEVDIAKIKLNQKATITFDAIDGLTLTGTVASIDSVGTVSQGVVSYDVTLSLDVDDARVKPGMSASATIMTDSISDVIVVPNSAIKTKNGLSYVETFASPLSGSNNAQGATSATPPTETEVTTGLADDTNTEITSGLSEGNIIVTKTVTSTIKQSSTSSAPSIFGAVGGRAGAGTFRRD